tara:strand:+ start:1026 stop:3518 length:2493 start_codon:yes stop_codon:yes gene_type:complete
MSKLIGTNPNQVPSNADLGTAAFVDVHEFLLAEGSELSAINASITKTAKSVLIYDTRKDSDGGAWRKRTQDTSWYNERLNTATRGSRRDFPSVALIVLEDLKVTIYDADNALLPMWMVFESGLTWNSAVLLAGEAYPLSCISMMNAHLAIGTGPNAQGLVVIEFIQDRARAHLTTNQYGGYDDYPLSERNSPGHDFSSAAYGNRYTANILSNAIIDVAMVVLPNAPIDVESGIAVPTIAAATYEGISVLRDDLTVVNFQTENNAGYNGLRNFLNVDFTTDGMMLYNSSQHGRTTGNYQNAVLTYLSVDKYQSFTANYSVAPKSITLTWDGNIVYVSAGVANTGTTIGKWDASDATRQRLHVSAAGRSVVVRTRNKLVLFDYADNPSNPLLAHITTDYNTGWMNNGVVLATLCDKDQTPDTSKEIIKNGNFDIDTAGWSTGAGASISHSSGTAISTSNGSNAWNGVYQGIGGLVVGKKYILTADIITSNNWGSINICAGVGSANKFGAYTSWNGGSTFPMKARAEWTATQTAAVVQVDSLNTTNATVTQFDNVTLRLAEDDRSPVNRALITRGNIRKVPVAPGSDLCAYTGFTAGDPGANRLERPYSADLAFGTGDFSVQLWLKDVADGDDIIGLGNRADNLAWNFYQDAGGGLRVHVSDDGNNYINIFEHQFGDNQGIVAWTHVCFFRKAGTFHLAINGIVTKTNDAQIALDLYANISQTLMIGSGSTNHTTNSAMKVSLLRISKGSSPSPDQIAKMYYEEKALFLPNAKATLYGVSDNLTAADYDDDTQLLHAGTSSGRSVFRGLRRIDNTTEAVGSSISASNGMVSEE